MSPTGFPNKDGVAGVDGLKLNPPVAPSEDDWVLSAADVVGLKLKPLVLDPNGLLGMDDKPPNENGLASELSLILVLGDASFSFKGFEVIGFSLEFSVFGSPASDCNFFKWFS